jgi:hypothetical protein
MLFLNSTSTAGTTITFTWNTVAPSNTTFTTNTVAPSNTTFTTTSSAHVPKKASLQKPTPPPPKFRKGDPVRVTAAGVLRGRMGLVEGFLAVGDQWTVFVGWPDGGWTTLGETSLETVPETE